MVVVPTLTMKGWVSTAEEMIDFSFADFLASEYSQSTICRGTIASLPYLIQQYRGNLEDLCLNVRETLQKHLENVFETVYLEVGHRTLEEDATKISLVIRLSVVLNGQAFNLKRVVENINSKTLRLIDINNG